MADLIFDTFKKAMADGALDLDGDTFKIALFTDASVPAATYDSYDTGGAGVALTTDDVEVTNGSGYTTGGATLASVTWNESAGTVTFDATDPQWTSATFTARYAAIYDTSSTGTTNQLVCMIDFGSDKSVTSGTFTIQFHTNGIFTLA